MDSSGSHRVGGDLGSRPNSPVSVEGGKASHAPSMNEQGQVAGGAVDILQKIAQALQRAVQLATVTPQRSAIERMARLYPPKILWEGKMMSLLWQRIGLRGPSECLCNCIALQKRNWNLQSHYFKMKLISGGFP